MLAMAAGQAMGQVQHGIVTVVENDGLNNASSVSVSFTTGFGSFTQFPAGHSRGDFEFTFVPSGSDADTLGLLVACAYQGSRIEPSVTGPYYASAMTSQSANPTNYVVNTHWLGNEANVNFTMAYFPYGDGWLASNLQNSANNGPMASAFGPFALVPTITGVGNEVADPTGPGTVNGFYVVSAPSVDFRRDGVLLSVGTKNENNRASWSTDYIDGFAYLWCQDLAADGGSGENDPAGFVFIPENTSNVTMGTVTATAKTLFKQGDFTVSMVGQPSTDGTFELIINGESPTTGTLLLAPYIRPDRAGTTIDNPVWAEANAAGTGWIITTRDQPAYGLQDLTGWDVAFSFAFLKNGVEIRPGTPSRAYRNLRNEVAAARFTVSEFTPNNGNGDMDCVRSAGNPILNVAGINRGDNQISYLGALLPSIYDNSLDAREGLMLGTPSQFVRDNTATGGVSGWSTLSFDNGDAVSHCASITGGEINADFALVHFAASRGFQGESDQTIASGLLTLNPTGVTSAVNEGVLMAINWDNNNRIIQVTPNGSGYDLTPYEAQNVTINSIPYSIGQVATDSVETGWVYLPYSTPGLIAGHIAVDDGSILSRTGNFTITEGTDAAFGFDIFELTIPGVDARTDGMLLLNASNGAYAMAFEAGENGEFEIAGYDLLSQQIGRCAFSFAYIPYSGFGRGITGSCCVGTTCQILTASRCAELNGTYNGDGTTCDNNPCTPPACTWQADGCFADYNNDDGIDGDDVIAFFNDWDNGNICADVDLSEGVDGDDVILFFASWDLGGTGFPGC
jgi:hypothetical protein